jgi:hypothetical protein
MQALSAMSLRFEDELAMCRNCMNIGPQFAVQDSQFINSMLRNKPKMATSLQGGDLLLSIAQRLVA